MSASCLRGIVVAIACGARGPLFAYYQMWSADDPASRTTERGLSAFAQRISDRLGEACGQPIAIDRGPPPLLAAGSLDVAAVK
jgi:hypothetical protein